MPDIKAIMNISRREMTFIFYDSLLKFLLILAPLFLFIFYAYLYANRSITDMPVAICDEDCSELSRSLVRAIDAAPAMTVIKVVSGIDELKTGIKTGIYKAGFYFPGNLEKNVKSQKSAFPVFYKNAQNIIISNYIYKETVQIFKTFNAGILLKKIRVQGLSEVQARSIVQPVAADMLFLYNQNFSYVNFLSPAFTFVQCQIILMIAGVLVFTREYELSGSDNQLIRNTSPVALLLGKMIPVLAIFGCIILVTIFILFPLSKIYLSGSHLNILFCIALLLLASFFSGAAIGIITRTTLFSLEVIVFISMPSLLLSGYTFPAIPKILSICAQVLPFTHFTFLFFKTAQMNCPLLDSLQEITILALFTIGGFIISCFVLGYQKKLFLKGNCE